MSAHHGPRKPAGSVAAVVLTASDTRTLEDDVSGGTARSMLESAGHPVMDHRVLPDDPVAIRDAIRAAGEDPAVRVVLVIGGTGIAPRDRTYEAVSALLERPIPGFGELFRVLSHRQVGSAAMLSRATAGVRGRQVIFCVPGSTAAVRLALEELILPEASHLIGLLDGAGS